MSPVTARRKGRASACCHDSKPSRSSRARFTHRTPASRVPEYRTFFKSEVRFGAAHTEMIFEESVLDAPLPTADANLLALLLPLATAQREGWRITHILNTHHHNDHTGGNRRAIATRRRFS